MISQTLSSDPPLKTFSSDPPLKTFSSDPPLKTLAFGSFPFYMIVVFIIVFKILKATIDCQHACCALTGFKNKDSVVHFFVLSRGIN
jgi:hypothetical protein